jgi:hypothetical protein
MKLPKLLTMAVVAVMLLPACTSDEPVTEPTGGDATVTFAVDLPAAISSRQRTAYADGTTATRLAYALYKYDAATDAYQYVSTKTGLDVIDLKAEVTLNLLAGEKYAVAFWAAAKDAPYTFDGASATVSVNYDDPVANDEHRDAFYACQTFTANANATYPVSLTRPFAQLNIGTSDMEESSSEGNFIPAYSEVTVAAYDKFNILTGEIPSDALFANHTFQLAKRPQGETFPVEPNTYDYLAMNYVLVGDDQELSTVTVKLEDGKGASKTLEYSQIPLRRNYRTNIYGQLLTSKSSFKVEITPGFNAPDNNIEYQLWDGTQEAPAIDAEGNVLIENPAQLAGLAQLVTAGDTFQGKTITLDCDIDMGEAEWKPIGGEYGSKGTFFKGTFDGQGHSIANMQITEFDQVASAYGRAMFYELSDGAVVKNLNVVEPDVFNEYGYLTGNVYGAVAAYAYGNVTFENVHVRGGRLLGFGKVGGILGMAADSNGKTVMRNCSVEDLDIYFSYNAAGLIGLAQNEVVLEDCYTDNLHTHWYSKSGGFQGGYRMNNVTFTNNSGVSVATSGLFVKYTDSSNNEVFYYAAWADYYNDYYYNKYYWQGDPLVFNGVYLADGIPHNK